MQDYSLFFLFIFAPLSFRGNTRCRPVNDIGYFCEMGGRKSSTVGNILIFCVGVNLVWGKKVRVANLLPALIFAVCAAFLPI